MVMSHIGVCSWSLKPASPADLVYKVKECGLRNIQLALDPIRRDPSVWPLKDTWKVIDGADVSVLSGMMAMDGEDYSSLESIRRTGGLVPDATWRANLAAARENAEIAHQYGLELVPFHAGFVPHDPADPLRAKMVERIIAVAECFAEHDITIALETGQESAETLQALMEEIDHPMIGINFDPANMLLYGNGDPIKAIPKLGLFIDQVHIKDALPPAAPGQWGTEVVVGTGGVDWDEFFKALADEDVDCDLLIEREHGDDRLADIRAAAEFIAPISGVKEAGK